MYVVIKGAGWLPHFFGQIKVKSTSNLFPCFSWEKEPHKNWAPSPFKWVTTSSLHQSERIADKNNQIPVLEQE